MAVRQEERPYELLGIVALLLVTAIVLFPAYNRSFYLDDYKHLEIIASVARNPWRAYQVANPFWIGWFYRPVQHWFILANYWLFGTAATGYYATLLGLHLLSITLLYAVARTWRAGRFAAFCAAALFGIHFVHQDVLGWISSASVAAGGTFALIAVLAYSRFLHQSRRSSWLLVVAAGATVLGLLSREENFVLPFVLVAAWALQPERRRPVRAEALTIAFLLGILALYTTFQLARESWTVGLQGTSLGQIWHSIRDLGPFHVIVKATLTYLLPSLQLTLPTGMLLLFGMLLLALLAFWYTAGGPLIRLGLIWSTAYVAFLYVPVGSQSLGLAPRYLYLPWLGLALAAGASLGWLANRWPDRRARVRGAILACLLAILIYQVGQARTAQEPVNQAVQALEDVRQQLLALVPSPAENTHFFALQLPQEPDYIQAMASVWYDRRFPWPGGHVGRLLKAGQADGSTIVLNYEAGRLYNLMPELREGSRTIFLGSEPPLVEVVSSDGGSRAADQGSYQLYTAVGPPGQRRLGHSVRPPGNAQGWTSLAFTTSIPEDAVFRTGVWRDSGDLAEGDGQAFRVRLVRPSGESIVLYQTFLDPTDNGRGDSWTEIEVSVAPYAGETVEIRLETAAGENLVHDDGYWANPRFVIEGN